jgi:hypothetical protein
MRYYPHFRRAIPHQEVDSYLLLTRLPLSGLRQTARLACLRHTASIHPEPGSNSQIKINEVNLSHIAPYRAMQNALPATSQMTNTNSSLIKVPAYKNKKRPNLWANYPSIVVSYAFISPHILPPNLKNLKLKLPQTPKKPIISNMKPDWERYYRETSPIPLTAHGLEIAEVIRRLTSTLTDPQPPFSFALGGIHPNVTSVSDFVRVCQEASPKPENQYIIFDIHPEAIPPCSQGVETIKDDLTQLIHFPDSSIDFLILHFTLMFLDKQQLIQANQSLARVISPRGAILAFIEGRNLHNCFGLFNPNHVPTHYHQSHTLQACLDQFKPSLTCYCHPDTYLFTLTHTDSPYSTHTGDPLDFESYFH